MLHRVAAVDEIPAGGRKSVVLDDIAILLLRAGNDFYAIEDVCTHDGQPLTDGPFHDHQIQCPRHGARFDIVSGKALCMPAIEPVAVFEVEVQDGQVYIRTQD